MTKLTNMNTITKTDVDNYFNKNYNEILLAIKKTKIKYNPNGHWEEDELLSDTYEHLILNVDKIESIKQIEAFTMRYMTNQIKWANSKINRLHISTKTSLQEEIRMIIIDDDSDLEDKIRIETEYNNQKAILYQFYQQLPTKQEKILFEVIFYKGIKTVKALSEHFKINKNYIQIMKKKLMDDLKEYIKNK